MSVETEVRELKEQVEQLAANQGVLQSTLNDLMGMLQESLGAGSPGPPQLDEEN